MSDFNSTESDPLTHGDIEEILAAVSGPISGTDSNDAIYDSIQELWKKELKAKDKKTGELKWYTQGYDYWEKEENCPISDDGVLGGYGKVTPEDIRDSNMFLDELSKIRPEMQFERAADGGAGIGRVTKLLLLPRFAQVDMVESSPRLLNAAPGYIGSENASRANLVMMGLQNFHPEPNTYDVIWIQWVIGHLHDMDYIEFFRRMAKSLKPGGVIILKDNCASDWTFIVDKEDSSVARHRDYHKLLFDLSGLDLILEKVQTDFPTELLPVHMFALAPVPQRVY